jgi:midasin (ATPase involved in ribosome maturation)
MICLSGLQEASFVGEGEKRVLKFTKYLDSFPFPYYIVLKNIEALPRTLADLLRQVSLFYNFFFFFWRTIIL